jgi:hypothetical protein
MHVSAELLPFTVRIAERIQGTMEAGQAASLDLP